jgi:hypothetical protein
VGGFPVDFGGQCRVLPDDQNIQEMNHICLTVFLRRTGWQALVYYGDWRKSVTALVWFVVWPHGPEHLFSHNKQTSLAYTWCCCAAIHLHISIIFKPNNLNRDFLSMERLRRDLQTNMSRKLNAYMWFSLQWTNAFCNEFMTLTSVVEMAKNSDINV